MRDPDQPAPARSEKRASAFRTIGEVADELDLPAHVLRFWESKFPQLKPLKRGGGRRYYRPEDIDLLRRIRQCLYQDGYTIRGVQKLLGDPSVHGAPARDADNPSLFPLDPAPDEAAAIDPERRTALEEIRRELREARALLDQLLRRSKPP